MPLVIPPSLLGGRAGGRSSVVVSSPSSSSSSSSGLLKTLAVGVTGYCAAWGVYYLVQDTIRNSTISKRKRRFDNRVRRSSSTPSRDVPKEERKAAVIERFASLSVLGRYVNPFSEWREQGAWEYVAWKSWILFIQGRLWYDGGLKKLKKTKEGRARIEGVLPVRQPDWDKYPQTASSRSPAEEEDWHRMSKSDFEGEGGALSRLPSEDGKIRYTW
jgi:N-acyl-phosphatidylethanolamine-hydrolysing phospholipase D